MARLDIGQTAGGANTFLFPLLSLFTRSFVEVDCCSGLSNDEYLLYFLERASPGATWYGLLDRFTRLVWRVQRRYVDMGSSGWDWLLQLIKTCAEGDSVSSWSWLAWRICSCPEGDGVGLCTWLPWQTDKHDAVVGFDLFFPLTARRIVCFKAESGLWRGWEDEARDRFLPLLWCFWLPRITKRGYGT